MDSLHRDIHYIALTDHSPLNKPARTTAAIPLPLESSSPTDQQGMAAELQRTAARRLWWIAVAMLAALGSLVADGPAAAADAPPSVQLDGSHRQLLEAHCFSCHGDDEPSGNVRLDDLGFTIDSVAAAERWQKVLGVLNAGSMPPEDEPPLPATAKADLVDQLARTMVAARKSLANQQGRIVMRRLNRREYAGTLKALLGVAINVAELPADTGNGSFDTVGSNLFMSANQFEQYRALGREAIEEALARAQGRGRSERQRYEAEEGLRKLVKVIHEQREGRERARRWVKAFDEAATRPENAEIVATLRKQARNESEFRHLWHKIPGAPSPTQFGFGRPQTAVVGNEADKANRALGPYHLPYHEYALEFPGLGTGTYLAYKSVHPAILDNSYVSMLVPFNWPPGDFVMRVRLAANEHATPERRFVELGLHPRSGQVLATHEVTGTLENPQVIELPLSFTRQHTERGDRTLFVREKASQDTNEQSYGKIAAGRKKNGKGPDYCVWIDWIEIERVGTSEHQPRGLALLENLFASPSAPDREQLRDDLKAFCLEAFRGSPPPDSFLDKLLTVYELQLANGEKHPDAVKDTLSVVLAAPMFLYLAEPAVDGSKRPLTQPELASRLAYFLWGTPPDDELASLAAAGELADPMVLASQVERLLDDPRSAGFLEPFVYQWLGLHRFDFFEVDRSRHPEFDDSVRLAAKREVFETVGHLLATNGSLRDLLAADSCVINNVLARFYGIEGVTGDQFRPVPLPPDSPRGGLLGMAAVHFMGGNGSETSPVERGAWVLRKLLDDPPPPAPANVPAISRLADKLVTTAERLRLHQEEPQCASCHRRIDPIGLGLENFDAVGRWRIGVSVHSADKKTTKTWAIDPAGALHGGPAFADFFELRAIIASQPEAFARGFSRALAEYALGRPCGFSDEQLLDDMVLRAATKNYPIRELFQALVASEAFHTK